MVQTDKNSFQTIKLPELSSAQKRRVVELWNAEYPASLQFQTIADFDEYLARVDEKTHFLSVDPGGKIAAWLMSFARENAKWFAIIVDRDAQGLGLGKRLINEVCSCENEIYGWVIATDEYRRSDGETYRSPLNFYEKLGFSVVPGETLMTQGISGVKIVRRAQS